MIWTIEYNNDTGPDDESFSEWWIVTNGKRHFKCSSEGDAEWLRMLLEKYTDTE
jgi:hypothetical protein